MSAIRSMGLKACTQRCKKTPKTANNGSIGTIEERGEWSNSTRSEVRIYWQMMMTGSGTNSGYPWQFFQNCAPTTRNHSLPVPIGDDHDGVPNNRDLPNESWHIDRCCASRPCSQTTPAVLDGIIRLSARSVRIPHIAAD